MLSEPLSEYQLAIAPKHVISIDVEGTNYIFSSRINLCGISVFTLTGSTYSFDFYNSYTETQAPELNYFLAFHSDSLIIGHNIYTTDFPILKHYLSPEVLLWLYNNSIDTYHLSKIFSTNYKIKGQGLLKLESLSQSNFAIGKMPLPKGNKRSHTSDSSLIKYNKMDTQLTFLLWHKMLLNGEIQLSPTKIMHLNSTVKDIFTQFFIQTNPHSQESDILVDILCSKIKSKESLRLLNNLIEDYQTQYIHPMYMIRAYCSSPIHLNIRMTFDESEINKASVWNDLYWEASIQIPLKPHNLMKIAVNTISNIESQTAEMIWLGIKLEDTFSSFDQSKHYSFTPKVIALTGFKKVETCLLPRMIFARYNSFK